MAQESITGLVKRLVKACEDEHGRTPERIVVEPNGEREVNARVGFRDERHPEVYFATR